MEGQMILALVLAAPIIIFPTAFVWYLNVSGLLKVAREARQRQKRRAMREGKEAVAVKH